MVTPGTSYTEPLRLLKGPDVFAFGCLLPCDGARPLCRSDPLAAAAFVCGCAWVCECWCVCVCARVCLFVELEASSWSPRARQTQSRPDCCRRARKCSRSRACCPGMVHAPLPVTPTGRCCVRTCVCVCVRAYACVHACVLVCACTSVCLCLSTNKTQGSSNVSPLEFMEGTSKPLLGPDATQHSLL